MEARFTTQGDRFGSMMRVAYWVSAISATTFTSNSSRIWSVEVIPINPWRMMPALLTRTSSRPCSLRADATRFLAKEESPMSPRMARAGCSGEFSSAATVSTPSPRAHSSRLAPSDDSARAIAAPIPRLAPVTRTIRPSSSIEADTQPSQYLASFSHRAHRQDIVGVQHDVELTLEFHDEGHVGYGIPLLDAVVGQIVGRPLPG